MTRVYYKEAVGAFIVFDVTRVQQLRHHLVHFSRLFQPHTTPHTRKDTLYSVAMLIGCGLVLATRRYARSTSSGIDIRGSTQVEARH